MVHEDPSGVNFSDTDSYNDAPRPSLPDEDAVLLLLYGLLRSVQIVLRHIDARKGLPKPKLQLKGSVRGE